MSRMKDHIIEQLPSPAEIAATLADDDQDQPDEPDPDEADDAPRDASVQPTRLP